MSAVRVDMWVVEEAPTRVVLMLLDLRSRRGSHVAYFLVIVEMEEREEELDRRLGSCRVVDGVDQDDVEVVESLLSVTEQCDERNVASWVILTDEYT